MMNIVDATDTLVLLDAIQAGFTDGIEDTVNHRITPAVAGYYSINGQVRLQELVANVVYQVFVKISGALLLGCENWVHSSNVNSMMLRCGMPSYYLTATDYLELWVHFYCGANTVDISSAYSTCLAIQRVR